MPETRITISVEDALLARIDELAKRERRSRTAQINIMLEAETERMEHADRERSAQQ
jgi:metal-responsive CopG/Arc/MetJ family transcriptional regulator